MIDAIVIPLDIPDSSICEYWSRNQIQTTLQFAYERGYGSLPVLFSREIKGMRESDCERLWGGIECQDGYRKDFFSQEYNFANGACIH
jgi:hypothetical protein